MHEEKTGMPLAGSPFLYCLCGLGRPYILGWHFGGGSVSQWQPLQCHGSERVEAAETEAAELTSRDVSQALAGPFALFGCHVWHGIGLGGPVDFF